MIVLLWDAFSLCMFVCSWYGGGNMAEKPPLMTSVLALTPWSQRSECTAQNCWELPCTLLEGCWWGTEGGTDLPLEGSSEKLVATLPHVGSVCREWIQQAIQYFSTIFATFSFFPTIAPSACPTRTEQQQLDKKDLWKFLFLFYKINTWVCAWQASWVCQVCHRVGRFHIGVLSVTFEGSVMVSKTLECQCWLAGRLTGEHVSTAGRVFTEK